jgi:hypothetical protein
VKFAELLETGPFGLGGGRKEIEAGYMTAGFDDCVGDGHTETSGTAGDGDGLAAKGKQVRDRVMTILRFGFHRGCSVGLRIF